LSQAVHNPKLLKLAFMEGFDKKEAPKIEQGDTGKTKFMKIML
jgi:hypothetical protein